MVTRCLKTIYLSIYTHIFVALKYDSEIIKGAHAQMSFFRIKFCGSLWKLKLELDLEI